MRIVFTFCYLCFALIAHAQNKTPKVENEIIVQFKVDQPKMMDVVARFDAPTLLALSAHLDVKDMKPIINKTSNNIVRLVFNPSEFSLEQIIELYKNTGYFEYVEPNFIATGSGVENTQPNDTQYGKQWGLKNDGTFSNAPATIGADIEMEQAWDVETGDSSMVVAIIDTGARLSHPEFSGRIWVNENETMDGTDSDNNGFVDDVTAGWDFINNDNNPADDHGHGTNVAGIAIATGNNSIGYAGVNWNSKIMICKALDANNSGNYAAIAGSIYYAVDNGAKVINMSIGGSGESTTLKNAVDYCYNNGVILVVCMMNFNNSVNYYPAAYSNTIAVGSTDSDDTRSNPFFWSTTSGSNYGNHIDLVAPGNFMYGLSYSSDTYYGSYWGGTSQATPLVAGVVSLMLAQNPSLTFEDIRTILRESAEDQVGDPSEDAVGFDIYYGYGRLNANNALNHQLLSVNKKSTQYDDLLIYPNPVNKDNAVIIANLMQGDYEITIYNMIGQNISHVKESISNNKKLSISTANLKKGTYSLTITNESNNRSITKNLIVN
jgi:thermitase